MEYTVNPTELLHTITESMLYKYIVVYMFILEIVASQKPSVQGDPVPLKNIFFRLFTNFLLFKIMDFPLIQTIALTLLFTTLTVIAFEK